MCLGAVTKDALIAKEDILVYKVLSRSDASPYQYFKYLPNMHYTLDSPMKLMHSYASESRAAGIIAEAYHAYNPARVEVYTKKHYSGINVLVVYDKLRRYELNIRHTRCYKVVKCWIPKGAKYFLGLDGDIASNQFVTGDLKPIRLTKLKQ